MICTSCQSQRHDHCSNNYNQQGELRIPEQRTKTWCDCQHREGVHIAQEFCQHRLYVEGMTLCPNCGKDMRTEEPSDGSDTGVIRIQSGDDVTITETSSREV